MKKLVCLLFLFTTAAYGQNVFKAKIIDSETEEPLIGATVQISPTVGAIADSNGFVELKGIPDGTIEIKVSFVGYQEHRETLTFPRDNVLVTIKLEPLEEFEEVIVTSTRSSRTIESIPTRIEFLGSEELEEKAVMRSANIAMLLRESTGIQMQITSPSSANQSIRIQGLDGRYTQLLKDGFPLYGGFSGGLSIMQIPPLDLRQVEVIKGSNSTLYGGGAIAGIVNLVSIQPEETPKLKLMFDQTTAKGSTLNSFYAHRKHKVGFSLFGSGHRQEPFDPNDDNFSDLPEVRSLTINPVFYYYPSETDKIRLSLNGTFEDRHGGNLTAISRNEGSISQFLQENKTRRLSYQLSYEKQFENGQTLVLKNSLLHFDREINQFNYSFDGEQIATFSEATYRFGSEKSEWLIGANYYTDRFKEGDISTDDRSYEQQTVGVFLQQNESLSEVFSLESGLRIDRNDDFGWFVLPRIALLLNPGNKLTYRLGGGLGYKTPTIFTEDTERFSFQNLQALNLTQLDAERSYGGNFDINYKTALGNEWTFSINQLFFYTRLDDPVVIREELNTNTFFFENADGPVRTQGIETNVKLTFRDFKLFLNYALLDTELKYDNINAQKPLTAKHNGGAVLVYEQHGKWRIGLEAYYTGEQFRSDFTTTEDYWIVGFMALRKFRNLSVYMNFENFSDTRQSRFENINLGSSMMPEALDVWAPLDGFILNTGVIWELGH